MSFQVYQAQGLRIFAGDTATCAGYTGNAGEISVNTETKAVYVHDGLTAGGTPLTTASEAEMLGMTLGQLANVYLESQSDKSLLSFDLNSDSWKSIEGLKVSDLLDMAVNTPSEGDLLAYDGATQKWKNVPASTGGAGATNLTGLDDVNLVSPANDQVLSYNSSTSKWENKAAPAGSGGGGSLPRIDWGDYTVTMDGQVDDEKDENGSGYLYLARTGASNNTPFDQKNSLYDMDSDDSDLPLLAWDYALNKWKMIRGRDFMTRGNTDARYYPKNDTYSKAQVDSAIAAGAAAAPAGGGGVPIGTIAIWATLTNGDNITLPEGWIPCNGTKLGQASYPELFAVYGYAFSAGKMQNWANGSGDFMTGISDIEGYQASLPESQRYFYTPDFRNKVLIGADRNTPSGFLYHPDLAPDGSWSSGGFDSDIANTMPLTWNETLVAGPTYTDYSEPWIYPWGNEKAIMPDGRFVSYIVKAK